MGLSNSQLSPNDLQHLVRKLIQAGSRLVYFHSYPGMYGSHQSTTRRGFVIGHNPVQPLLTVTPFRSPRVQGRVGALQDFWSPHRGVTRLRP